MAGNTPGIPTHDFRLPPPVNEISLLRIYNFSQTHLFIIVKLCI